MRLVAILLAITVATHSPAQQATREIRSAFRGTDDVRAAFAERNAALDLVTRVDDARQAEALVRAWQRANLEARSVERERGRPAVQPIPSISEMTERAELDVCLRLMSRIEGLLASARGEAVPNLLDATFGGGLPVQLRATLAPLASRRPHDAAVRAREALRDAKRPDDQWVALRALEACGQEGVGAGELVAARLADRESIVRTQSARTLAALRFRAGAPKLIARLDEEHGRARRNVLDSLQAITGLKLGAMSASWRAWWQVEGEAFLRGEKPAPRPPAKQDADGTRGAFFGVPQDGESILYLVDFSKSMAAPLHRGQRGSPTRWQACLDELQRAIDSLGPDRQFNIVVFGQRVVAWRERQVAANSGNVADAEAWLHDLRLELGTAVFEAFEVAFWLGGQNLEDRYFEPTIDTICFLSDGRPTVRRPDSPRALAQDDPKLVRMLVHRRNPFGSVRVNTVFLGRGSGGGALMQQLAQDHGGTYVAP